MILDNSNKNYSKRKQTLIKSFQNLKHFFLIRKLLTLMEQMKDYFLRRIKALKTPNPQIKILLILNFALLLSKLIFLRDIIGRLMIENYRRSWKMMIKLKNLLMLKIGHKHYLLYTLRTFIKCQSLTF